jgi:tRNA uridine 5-carboxymethylaminomethyl modification enzyme
VTEPRYDVIVVGAGHAGCEAALAAARMGRRTLLITMNLDLIALMPCNPSIGGPAKAHLVREVDALGGAMARNIDRTLIQIRMLNLSKGPAVQALRAQADKRLYSLSMKQRLEQTPGLDLMQGQVVGLQAEAERITGVTLAWGGHVVGRTVVVTSGTFLNGQILSGEYRTAAGRAGEQPAAALSQSLAGLGLALGRLQTNTPPRIDARTIDYTLTVPHYGSDEPLYFSQVQPPEEPVVWPPHPAYPVDHQTAWRPQLPCYLVRTNAETHRVIRDNLHRSPIAPGAGCQRPALLPFGGRQGGALCLQGEPPVLPGARGLGYGRGVRAGLLYRAARGGPGRAFAHHPGTGRGPDHAARLCHCL